MNKFLFALTILLLCISSRSFLFVRPFVRHVQEEEQETPEDRRQCP